MNFVAICYSEKMSAKEEGRSFSKPALQTLFRSAALLSCLVLTPVQIGMLR